MSSETLQFQTEVTRLLDIVAKSLYSEKEIFVRELVSNASDACDRLRYAQLTDTNIGSDSDFQITITPNKDKKTLTISDNGMGMSRDDLIENLGTIARSGTAKFMESLSGKDKDSAKLIGQFGVGFYSSFIVSDKVEVITKKANEEKAYSWISDGKGSFDISEASRENHGTDIILYLKDEEVEFLEKARIQHIIKSYSDHIAIPIFFREGENEKEQLNQASALWTRAKSEISEKDYKEFYHHVAHAFDEPWHIMHNQVEGTIAYQNLLFIPSSKPFDLFAKERPNHVKLYVRRVFITDKCEELLPRYLRFVRGIVDSQDLPLNLSRELLQNNAILSKIRTGLTKRVLNELKKIADKEPEKYKTFWDNFGAVLKEGLYEDLQNRDQLLKLARFQTSKSTDPISLEKYVKNMNKDQEVIYTFSGPDRAQLMSSPQIEGFLDRNLEVLLLIDPVDEFWIQMVGEYEGKKFQSITKGVSDLDKFKKEKQNSKKDSKKDKTDSNIESLIAQLKIELQDVVKDIRISTRLTSSPVCLVADEEDVDMNLEKILRHHNVETPKSKRILEVNDDHPLIQDMSKLLNKDKNFLNDLAFLLYDQACILEGETPSDPSAFSRRLDQIMRKSLAA